MQVALRSECNLSVWIDDSMANGSKKIFYAKVNRM